MKKLFLTLVAFVVLLYSCQTSKNSTRTTLKRSGKYVEPTTNRVVQLSTEYGNITIALSDSTPLHRNNFIKLIKQNFFDSLLFHRVIGQFMIQGGDPNSKRAKAGQMLGEGGSNMERIPAEFNKALFHRKGALAAARDGNPQKASSACQFYIVQGKTYSEMELNQLEKQATRKYVDSVSTIYKTIGGTPFLDMSYTVFGQVTNGLEVIDKITALPCDGNNRPINDVRMKIIILH